MSATLQGELDAGPLELQFTNTLAAEAWWLGDQSYYVNLRRDVILARKDYLLVNMNIARVVAPLPWGTEVSVGWIDETFYVPASRFFANRLAGLVTWKVKRVGNVLRDLEPFLALGIHTHNPYLAGEPYGVTGVSAVYDVW